MIQKCLFFPPSCDNFTPFTASGLITAPRWWHPRPPPPLASSPLLPLCFSRTPAEMSTVSIHALRRRVMILEADDKGALCSREMSGQKIWAPSFPWGKILSRRKEGAWSGGGGLLPPPPPSDLLLLSTASGLCTHMVGHGSWPPVSPWALSRCRQTPASEPIGAWWQL